MSKVIRTVEVLVETDDAVKDVKRLNRELDKTSEEAKEASKDINKMSDDTSKSSKKMSANFKAIGSAIKLSGIALLVAVVAKLGERFTQSAGGIRTVTTLMEGLNIVIDASLQYIKDIYDAWKTVFTDGFSAGMDKRSLAVDRFKDSVKNLAAEAQKLADLKIFSTEFKRGADIVAAQIEHEIVMQKQIAENMDLSLKVRIQATKQLNAEQSKLISLRQQAINNDIKYFEAKKTLTDEETGQLFALRAELIRVGTAIEEQRIENLNRQRSLLAEMKPEEVRNPVTGLTTKELEVTIAEQEGVIMSSIDGLAKYAENTDWEKAKRAKTVADFTKQTQIEDAQTSLAIAGNLAYALGELAEEGSEQQKKIRIAGAIIDTLAGAVAAMKAGLDAGGPWGIALGISTSLAVLASGYANVEKIRNTKIGDTSAGGSVPEISQPNFNIVEASSTNQLNETLAANNIEPVKAYVVSSEMTTQQALDRQIVGSAAIG